VRGRSARPFNRTREAPIEPADRLSALIADLEVKTGFKVADDLTSIGPDETLRQWSERLGRAGLKVDGKPFTLADRPAMAWVYD